MLSQHSSAFNTFTHVSIRTQIMNRQNRLQLSTHSSPDEIKVANPSVANPAYSKLCERITVITSAGPAGNNLLVFGPQRNVTPSVGNVCGERRVGAHDAWCELVIF